MTVTSKTGRYADATGPSVMEIYEERGITMKLTEEAIKTLLQAGEKMHADCGKVHLYLDEENYDEVLASVGDMANKDWRIHML